jgi:hypothetical protein
MKNNLGRSLSSYYEQFSVGHEQRRSQLLRSLSSVRHSQIQELAVVGGRTGMSQAWKSALALAAGLMIVVGAIFYLWPNQDGATNNDAGSGSVSINPLSPQEAYASAIDRVSKLESLRFIWTTPSSGKGASVEMWWRRPADYRMEFKSNGLVMTSQGERAITNPLAMSALSQLGRYFLLNQPASEEMQKLFVNDWLDHCRFVQSEKVTYKGEKCLKVFCVDNQWRYEYIIDAEKGTDTQAPFYELKIYDKPQGGRLKSHVEVLEVNKDYADSTFTK